MLELLLLARDSSGVFFDAERGCIYMANTGNPHIYAICPPGFDHADPHKP